MSTRHSAPLTAAIFLAIAISVSTIRPLWLDEILQLIETRQTSLIRMTLHVRQTPGAMPLGYLVQQIALKITGYSTTFARLPSALFEAAAVFVVALIAHQSGLKRPWVAAAIFAVFPQTLRYAAESRTYAQALFFSVVATYLYLRLARNPTPAAAAHYWLALTLAVYTQPYSISVGVAHWICSMISRLGKTALLCGSAVALASIAFLPWFWWAHAAWAASNATSGFQFAFSIRTPLMLFREFAGAGYFGSALLLLLCAGALPGSCIDKPKRMLLVLLIASAPVMVLCADAAFGYFVAARQIIWVLPAAAILTAAAIECHPRVGWGLTALLAIICIRQSIVFYRSPGENWELAAMALAEQVREGNCLAVAPAEQAPLYEFFQPELRTRPCRSGSIVLAITPAATDAQERNALASLVAAGHKVASVRTVGRTRIVLFQ